jgi:hypothetical protein
MGIAYHKMSRVVANPPRMQSAVLRKKKCLINKWRHINVNVNQVCRGRLVEVGGFNAKRNLKAVRHLYIEEDDCARGI